MSGPTPTRPTGEQLRFRSSATGDHVLDAYLEAAEKGGRTLSDLLDDLFDGDGVFRDGNFEFRYNSSTSDLEYRVGQFANSTDGWIKITPLLEDTGVFNSATTYENLQFVTDSLGDTYVVHGLSSPTTFADEAAFQGSANTTKIVNVSLARAWAIQLSTPVEGSDYSAKYNANLAQSYRNTAEAHKDAAAASETAAEAARNLALSYRNAAQSAQTASETARDLAQQWAEEAEDTEVLTGQYSSLHHSAKAQAAQTAAEAARDSAQAIYDGFDDRYLGVKASDPTTDNDGDPLAEGAFYWNSSGGYFAVYNGSAWVALPTGTMAAQNASAVAITGGSITNATGAFTQLDADNIRIDGNTISSTNTNGDINLTPDGTGKVVAGALTAEDLTVSRNAVEVMRVHRDSSAGGGGIALALDNSAGVVTDYALVAGRVVVNTAGAENGRLDLRIIENGAMTEKASLSTNGTTATFALTGDMTVTDELGIGLTAPHGPFSVQPNNRVVSIVSGSDANAPRLQSRSPDNSGNAIMEYAAFRHFFISDTGVRAFVIAENSDAQFYRDDGLAIGMIWDASTQRLGVGTTIPGEKLDVRGSAQFVASSARLKLVSGVAGTSGGIEWNYNNPAISYADITLPYDTRGTVGLAIRTTNGSPITFNSGNGHRFQGLGTMLMELTDAGALVVGAPTGGAKGAGTINAVAVYDDNVLLTDLVLDFAEDGAWDREAYAAHPVDGLLQQWMLDPAQYAEAWRRERHLPLMVSWRDEANRPALGQIVTRQTGELELHAVHIANHEGRIAALEAHLPH